MSVGCSRCGACCTNISFDTGDATYGYWSSSDPRKDENWPIWVEAGWKDEDRERATSNWLSIQFIAEHWETVGRDERGWVFTCDQFDPTGRICTAHDERPDVCRGFPWYGKPPSFEKAEDLPKRCSFRADAVAVSIGQPPT